MPTLSIHGVAPKLKTRMRELSHSCFGDDERGLHILPHVYSIDPPSLLNEVQNFSFGYSNVLLSLSPASFAPLFRSNELQCGPTLPVIDVYRRRR